MRSIVNAKHGNNHILDFYTRYATLVSSSLVPIQRRFTMASLQTALRSAGLSSAPDAPEEPKIQVRQPVAVLKRELLWSGGIIEIKIPAVCREGAFEDIKFIQLARFVKGGVVNFFVHNQKPTLYCGKTITASVEVLCKKYADGRAFLYVDLRPITKPATHRLVVEPRLVFDL